MGIKYAFSPHTYESIINLSNKLKVDFIPGVSNEDDIRKSIKCGCNYLKYFPAEKLGGINYLNSITKAIEKISVNIIAKGGINHINIYPYLNHEKIIGIGSSWVANETLINESNWKEIERRAKLLLEI